MILLLLLVLVGSLFQGQFIVSITSAQNSLEKLLSINIISLIVIIIRYSPLIIQFFLSIYKAAYFIAIPCFLQKSLNLTNMNFNHHLLARFYRVSRYNFNFREPSLENVYKVVFFSQIKGLCFLYILAYKNRRIEISGLQ